MWLACVLNAVEDLDNINEIGGKYRGWLWVTCDGLGEGG